MTQRSLYVAFALILTVSLVSFSAPNPAVGQDLELSPEFAAEPIPDIWEEADGEDARSQSGRSWIWGPVIHSASQEPYVESPDGKRAVYYFDKARMEINNPNASQDSIWYATSGLLIREMMLGQIQVGDSESIDSQPAGIPVTGDLEDNPASPTYATLAEFTVLGDQPENRTDPQIGEPVRTMLDANGNTAMLDDPPYETEFVEYNETLGFNIPDVFWNWMDDQPIDSQYVIGHPVTPAFWVDTRIDGEETTVLVQAFERRVLTFNPENEPQWQVEAGNAGLHYRSWRDLSMPEDPSVHALAYAIPYGEIITDAALKNGVDPFLLAGVAAAASGFDPKAELTGDRAGLMGVPLQLLEQRGVEYPLDPTFNARVAADLLAMIHNQNGGDWQRAVEEYFNWQDAAGTFAMPPANAASDAISAWQEFESTYSGQPSPFGVEPDDVDGAGGSPSNPPDDRSDEIPELLEYYAEAYDLDPNVVKAVAWQESNWNQSTISSSGAIGVMQVMPGTAVWIENNLVDRELDVRGSVVDNIEAGAAYLAHRIDQFDDLEHGLAAYYMGPTVVQEQGITEEGRRYVDGILSLIDHFETYGEPPR